MFHRSEQLWEDKVSRGKEPLSEPLSCPAFPLGADYSLCKEGRWDSRQRVLRDFCGSRMGPRLHIAVWYIGNWRLTCRCTLGAYSQ